MTYRLALLFEEYDVIVELILAHADRPFTAHIYAERAKEMKKAL
jgi:hypothetical protein